MSRSILVTGFEAFPGVERNPSALVAMVLGDEYEHAILPVTRDAGDMVEELIRKHEIVLHFGVNIHINKLELERVAVNLYDSDKPDNNGYTANEEDVVSGGPAAYFSKLPVKGISAALKTRGVPCAVSNTAGTYICNLVFYRSLHAAASKNPGAQIGFIHIPMMPEEILVDWCRKLVEETLRLA